MTSVSAITHDHDYQGDAAGATERVVTANLDSDVTDIKNKINELIAALADVIRDDDSLNDECVGVRHLADEVFDHLDSTTRLEVVRVVGTTNHGLSGLAAIDGITPVAGDRIFLAGQTTETENGIYTAAAGSWDRSSDMATGAELDGVYVVYATEGQSYRGSRWQITADDLTVGTDDLEPVQIGPKTRRITHDKQAVSYAATVTPDVADGSYVQIGELTGNIQVNKPTNLVAGQEVIIEVVQDATGSRTMTWGTGMIAATAIDGTASKRSVWTFVYDAANDECVEIAAVTGHAA